MERPDPRPGLLIRYDYLWNDESRRGREEGAKNRPCAVVLTVKEQNGRQLAVICAITHSPPREKGAAIEIPIAVSRSLGLDEDRSWIVTKEINLVDWADPGIILGRAGARASDDLPRKLTMSAADQVKNHMQQRALKIVNRPEIEKARDRRERDDRDR